MTALYDYLGCFGLVAALVGWFLVWGLAKDEAWRHWFRLDDFD